MIVEDFVMLGKTVPEPAHDGRVFVCSAGVSRAEQAAAPRENHYVCERCDPPRLPAERPRGLVTAERNGAA